MKINLKIYTDQLDELSRTVLDENRQMMAAQAALTKRTDELTAELKKLIGLGYTTGDPLQDHIIRHFGIDRDGVEKLQRFNERYKKSQNILIIVPRKIQTKHVFIETARSKNEYMTEYGWIYGKPREETMQFPLPEQLRFILPTSRYATWGFEHIKDCVLAGNLDTGELDKFRIIGSVLLQQIMEDYVRITSDSFVQPSFVSIAPPPSILLDGMDLTEQKVTDRNVMEALRIGEQMIQRATPQEIIAGEHI